MWDILEVASEQLLRIKIIGTNSKNRQGFRLAIDVGEGSLEVNNITAKEMYFWVDTAPDEFICKCFSS
jgi:hypothetical protein